MQTLAVVLISLVALLHCWFAILEMFLWDRPPGLRAFGQTPEDAARTKILAANQGLYNGFLVAGLVWGLISGGDAVTIRLFFLSCVIVAGVFGAVTARRKILYVQALPALIVQLLAH